MFICLQLHFDHHFTKTFLSLSPSSSFDLVVTIVCSCRHHCLIMSSLMDTNVLYLLVQDEDLEELLMSSSCSFVFHSGMNCPVVSCGVSFFNTRMSYSRHWATKHKPHHIIFYCSIPGCKSTARERLICGTTSDQFTI